jgi:hypothetical protein
VLPHHVCIRPTWRAWIPRKHVVGLPLIGFTQSLSPIFVEGGRDCRCERCLEGHFMTVLHERANQIEIERIEIRADAFEQPLDLLWLWPEGVPAYG